MPWQQWLRDLGLPMPDAPDTTSILLAIALAAASFWAGWALWRRVGARVGEAIRNWTGRGDALAVNLVKAATREGLPALLLLVAINAAAWSPLALVILAVALALATALWVLQTARAAGLGQAIAGVLGAAAGVATAAGTLGSLQPLTTALDGVGLSVTHRITLLGMVNFVVIAAVLYLLARLANRVLTHSIGPMRSLDVSQRALVQKLGGLLVVVIAVLLAIDLLGIDLTALTVFSGAVGLAVGFGLQKTAGNLIAGLILLMDRSVKPGDVIAGGDQFGAVTKIGVRAVSVVTRDGKEHLIPNEQLMTEPVENWSYFSRNVRVHIPVGVAYDCDLPLAQRVDDRGGDRVGARAGRPQADRVADRIRRQFRQS